MIKNIEELMVAVDAFVQSQSDDDSDPDRCTDRHDAMVVMQKFIAFMTPATTPYEVALMKKRIAELEAHLANFAPHSADNDI